MVSESESSSSTKKKSLRQRIKNFMSSYGRTSYGGNPIVQQTLPTYIFYSSPEMVLPVYAVVAILFCILGAFIVVKGDEYYEVHETYSHINQYQYIPTNSSVNINQGIRFFLVGNETHSQGTRTRVTLEITKTLKAPVYLYYTLKNFYQNFRGFHDGRSRHQMIGTQRRSRKYHECRPFEKPGYVDKTEDKVVNVETSSTSSQSMRYGDFTYNPCGVAPWSMFNDTFILYRIEGGGDDTTSLDRENLTLICNSSDFDVVGEPLGGTSTSQNQCKKKGISWNSDKNVRFKQLLTGTHLWSLRYPHANDNPFLSNGWYANEAGHSLTDPADLDLQVWIRAALLPDFRKLLRIIDVDLEKGFYVMYVDEFFDVTTFGGEKGFLLRSSSWFGRDGRTIGIAFLVVGSLAFVLGVAFGLEFCLRYRHCERHLPEPKARWYLFDPNGVEMRLYYEMRTKRWDMSALKKDDSDDDGDEEGGRR